MNTTYFPSEDRQRMTDNIGRLLDERDRLRKENARLRDALSIYADLEYWGAIQGDDQEYLYRESIGQKTYVQGKRARAALEGRE